MGKMRKETNGRSANRQDGQRRWLGRAWRGRSERQGGQSRRATGAGGRRDAEAVLPPPPARCPGRSTSLISHLAAPGPVCAEPGIPPAAQIAPAPSSPPPRFPVPASPQEPGRPARSPGPSSARMPMAGHGWMGRHEPGARREGPGACRWGSESPGGRCSHRQGPRARRTSGHLARTPVRRRAVSRREDRCGGGGGGVPRLGGRAGEPFCGTGRKRVAAGGVAGC